MFLEQEINTKKEILYYKSLNYLINKLFIINLINSIKKISLFFSLNY